MCLLYVEEEVMKCYISVEQREVKCSLSALFAFSVSLTHTHTRITHRTYGTHPPRGAPTLLQRGLSYLAAALLLLLL